MAVQKTTRLTEHSDEQLNFIVGYRDRHNVLVKSKQHIIAELIDKEYKKVVRK